MAETYWAEIYSLAAGGTDVVASYADLDAYGPDTAIDAARAWAMSESLPPGGEYYLRVLQGKQTICSEPLKGSAAAG